MLRRSSTRGITVAFLLLLTYRHARAESERPFDPRWCWCGPRFVDVSIGHFTFDSVQGRNRFYIDTPVWNGPFEGARFGGTELEISHVTGVRAGPYLVYDQGLYQGYWCFVPISTANPSEIRLTTTVCERTRVQGGIIPDLCLASIPLPTVIEFSKAALSSQNCERTAEEHLGILGPEPLDDPGCGGSAIGRGIALVVLAFLTWRRRRQSSARESLLPMRSLRRRRVCISGTLSLGPQRRFARRH